MVCGLGVSVIGSVGYLFRSARLSAVALQQVCCLHDVPIHGIALHPHQTRDELLRVRCKCLVRGCPSSGLLKWWFWETVILSRAERCRKQRILTKTAEMTSLHSTHKSTRFLDSQHDENGGFHSGTTMVYQKRGFHDPDFWYGHLSAALCPMALSAGSTKDPPLQFDPAVLALLSGAIDVQVQTSTSKGTKY